jgi:RimJ/RimL family protein N-acetyltransferase
LILKGFEIELRPLAHKDIETVRQWRNSDAIRRYALSQALISQEDQERWFQALQHKKDEYFVIVIQNLPSGLIWFNIHEEEIETGFYVAEERYQNSLTPYKIVTLFHRYLFEEKGFENITCKIMTDNPRAVRFNLSLGYKEVASFERYKLYRLSRRDYALANAKIKALLQREKPCA